MMGCGRLVRGVDAVDDVALFESYAPQVPRSLSANML